MNAPTPRPWQWSVIDYSMAILHGYDVLEDAILAVCPCPACQKRAADQGNPEWKWARCTTPTEENAAFIVLAVNNHDSLLAALHAAHTRFGQMWPDRSPDSDETWKIVDAAIKRAEGV